MRRALAVGLLLAGPARLGAQAAGPARACLDAIPDSAMRRGVVFLRWDHVNALAQMLAAPRPAVDLLAQSVAQRMRDLLGGPPGVLPRGEPRLGWRDLGPQLTMVVRRDGSFRALAPSVGGLRGWTDAIARNGGVALMRQAADSLEREGERVPWSEAETGDSILVTLALIHETDPPPPVPAVTAPILFPVMSIAAPPSTAVRRIPSFANIHFPERWRHLEHVEVPTQFVVDSGGRADPSTLRDRLARENPTREQQQEQAIRSDFLREIGLVLGKMRFEPSRIGGCPVATLVQQTFTFETRTTVVR